MSDFLLLATVYLATMIVAVPVSTRLGLGSVLGYLIAGIIIGPATPGFVADVARVAPGTPVRVLDPLQAVTGA